MRARGEREILGSILPGGAPLHCDNCDESEAVTTRCVDCRHFLCATCTAAHARAKGTKAHEALPLAAIVPQARARRASRALSQTALPPMA